MLTFSQAMDFIDSFDKKGKPIKDLKRIVSLMHILGNPQDDLKFIHIAGTNGKGSVAQMCNNIICDAGYNVGLFTSPFIVEYSDRIRFNNINISKQDLVLIVEKIKNALDNFDYKSDFSQFEITTAIALCYFKMMKCDVVVFETGIGGRLDSTNVINNTIVSIITSISYDHTAILGETLKEISFHKAGIIKSGRPCVLSLNNADEVVQVVSDECDEKNSELVIPEISKAKINNIDFKSTCFVYDDVVYEINMSGKHQMINAISVIESMRFLQQDGFLITKQNIVNGIKSAKVMARIEIVDEKPMVIIDGAHNQAGVDALAKYLDNIKYNKCYAVIGMMSDKNAKKTVKCLVDKVDEFFCVDDFAYNSFAANKINEIITKCAGQSTILYSTENAIEKTKELAKENDLILICGSLYLASYARKIYKK